jgi:hypothetical protein
LQQQPERLGALLELEYQGPKEDLTKIKGRYIIRYPENSFFFCLEVVLYTLEELH